jgi:hypothetical protein
MKIHKRISKYIIFGIILPITLLFYFKFQESSRCRKEQESRNLEILAYKKKFAVDTSVTNNTKAYDIFFKFILKNRTIIFENIDENNHIKHDSYLFYNVDNFPSKIRSKAIQLHRDCHLENVYFTVLKSNPYIEIKFENKSYKGYYCTFVPTMKVYVDEVPVDSVREKLFIFNKYILYDFVRSCDYIEDCD